MKDGKEYIANKKYVRGNLQSKPDYGWRFHGRTVLLQTDRSVIYDESSHLMEEALREMSKEFYCLERCLQCGMCTSHCPNSLIRSDVNLSPRELIQKLRLGLIDLSEEELWHCTNCGGCTTNCPYEVPLIDVIISLRSLIVTKGAGYLPSIIKRVLFSVKNYKNPWMKKSTRRSDWLLGTDIRPAGGDSSILLFVCCSPAYESRPKEIVLSAVKLMERMGVGFETLGEEEVCCGDAIMRVGDLDTFSKLRMVNKSIIEARGNRNIYALSPHCFHIMKTKYFENCEESYSVKPFVLLLHEALKSGSLVFSKKVEKKVTFHDPCFLAKHNNIFEEPREILNGIPGINLVEMNHNRRNGICCGGGGGGVWLDREKGERLAEVRLLEALSAGAEVVVTSCPFCLAMLEDAALSDSKLEHIQVMDICELICEAL